MGSTIKIRYIMNGRGEIGGLKHIKIQPINGGQVSWESARLIKSRFVILGDKVFLEEKEFQVPFEAG